MQCAIEIQQRAREELDGQIRIGIHLGDVTFENEDVFGDGVNIASRLQSVADPGGIYISESTQKAIRGRSDIQAKYLGAFNLKNVELSCSNVLCTGRRPANPICIKDQETHQKKPYRKGIWFGVYLYHCVTLGIHWLVDQERIPY